MNYYLSGPLEWQPMAIEEWGRGKWIQVLAVNAFLMGCTDKRSAWSALDRDPKTVDEAMLQ